MTLRDRQDRPWDEIVAMVTGASGGIGTAVVATLATLGATVAMVGRSAASLKESASSLDNAGAGRLILLPGDVTNDDQVNEMVAQVISEVGRIDVLVTCAAAPPLTIESTALAVADFRKVLDVDVVGTFISCRAVARSMISAGFGRIVNLSSFHAVATYPRRPAYAASKAAVVGLTRALALEWGPYGITVNAIAPGQVSGPRTDQFLSEADDNLQRMLERTPLGRLGEPVDVANLVAFLCSDAAGYITGQTLVIDGGWTSSAWYRPFRPPGGVPGSLNQ